MSALTERVAREHVLTYRDDESGDWVCNCGLSIPADLEYMEHIAEVTAAEIAAEIRAEHVEFDRRKPIPYPVPEWDKGVLYGLQQAQLIAEGKTNG